MKFVSSVKICDLRHDLSRFHISSLRFFSIFFSTVQRGGGRDYLESFGWVEKVMFAVS